MAVLLLFFGPPKLRRPIQSTVNWAHSRHANRPKHSWPAASKHLPLTGLSSCLYIPITPLTEGAIMRRRAGGAGCGARASASQAGSREASGRRPPPLRGAALRWAGRGPDEGRRKPPGSRRANAPVRPRKLRSRGPKSPRWSAERRASGSSGRPRRKAWTEKGAARRSIPSGLARRRKQGRRPGAATIPGAMKLGCLKLESVLREARSTRGICSAAILVAFQRFLVERHKVQVNIAIRIVPIAVQVSACERTWPTFKGMASVT